MKILILLVLAVITTTVYSTGDVPGLIGEFSSKDGATCKLLEIYMGEKTHALVMECTCKDSAGEQHTYACSYYYDGDFKDCKDKEKVYKEVETGLVEASKKGACSVEKVDIPSELCPGKVTLTRHYSSRSKGVSPCLPRDEL